MLWTYEIRKLQKSLNLEVNYINKKLHTTQKFQLGLEEATKMLLLSSIYIFKNLFISLRVIKTQEQPQMILRMRRLTKIGLSSRTILLPDITKKLNKKLKIKKLKIKENC